VWQAARLAETKRAGEGLQALLLEVPSSLAAGYAAPGQYVQLRVGDADKPAFIALASPVGAHAAALELLVKRQPGTAEALCELCAGDAVQVSQVLGGGFPLAQLREASEVFLFATGSGLSPVRALLDTPAALGGLGEGESRRLHLYVGARSPEHLAFTERLAAWEQRGVAVTRVFSADDGRYVQHAFAAAGGARNAAATGVVLVGQKAMAEDLRTALDSAGVPRDRVISNF